MKLYSFSAIVLISVLMCSSVASQAKREIHKRIPLQIDGRLLIDTYKGSITITTHEKAQLEVDVMIESDNSDSETDEQDVEDTEILFDGEGSRVSIQTNYSKLEHHQHKGLWEWIQDGFESSYSRPLVHYTIKMPRTAELRIKDYKSMTRIENVHANVTFNTYKGNVEMDGLTGGVDLDTYKGKVRIAFDTLSTYCRFETYKGDVSVEIPKENGFRLKTNFEHRVDFTTNFPVTERESAGSYRHGHHHSNDYEGNLNGGGPVIEFSSHKGEIRLTAK